MVDPVSVPLGYWLRTVDSLFESSMDDVLASEDVTRRLWQVLGSIKRNEPASPAAVDQAMALFLDGEPAQSAPLLGDLAERGWIAQRDGAWSLTDVGRTAVARLEALVAEHRQVMFQGIDDSDYRTTVETLARVAGNLDPQGNRAAGFR